MQIRTGKPVQYTHPVPICQQWTIFQETKRDSAPPIPRNVRTYKLAIDPQDISNKFIVGMNGYGQIAIQRSLAGPISRKDALLLAAWLVLIADRNNDFKRILKGVQTL